MVRRFRRVVLDTAGRTRFSRMQSRQQAAMISASTASACHRSISGSAVKRRAMTRLSIRRHVGPPTTSSSQPRCSLSDIYMPRGNQDGSAYLPQGEMFPKTRSLPLYFAPRTRTIGTGEPGRGAGRVAQRPASPVPDAGAVTAQLRRSAPHEPPIQTAARLPARCARISGGAEAFAAASPSTRPDTPPVTSSGVRRRFATARP